MIKHQAGQAMIEYIVALSAVFMIFYITGGILFPVENTPCEDRAGNQVSPRDCLIDNMKGYYQGHSYALSLSEYPVSNPTVSVPAIIDDIAQDLCDNGLCDALDSIPSLSAIPEEFPPSLGSIVEEIVPNITINVDTLLKAIGIPEEIADLITSESNPTIIDIPFPP